MEYALLYLRLNLTVCNTIIENNNSFQPFYALQQNQENSLQIFPEIRVEENSNFGSDVAIDCNTMVVGCEGLALAYVFEKEGEDWVYKGKLTSDLLKTGSAFWHAVEIDGAICLSWQSRFG